MLAPLSGKLTITQLFASMRGGAGEAYTATHNGKQYACRGHCGIDFNCPVGTPVYAMKGGRLTCTPHDPYAGGYANALGLYCVITLPSGEEHGYAHLSEVRIPNGEIVQPGEVIALSGATGNVTGAHLHSWVRPPNPDFANGFDGTTDFITHFDHDVYPLLDLSLV